MAKYDLADLAVLDKVQTTLGLSEDDFLRFLAMVGRGDVIPERRRLKEEAEKSATAANEKFLADQKGRLARATGYVCKRCDQIIPYGEPHLESTGEVFHQGPCPLKA